MFWLKKYCFVMMIIKKYFVLLLLFSLWKNIVLLLNYSTYHIHIFFKCLWLDDFSIVYFICIYNHLLKKYLILKEEEKKHCKFWNTSYKISKNTVRKQNYSLFLGKPQFHWLLRNCTISTFTILITSSLFLSKQWKH